MNNTAKTFLVSASLLLCFFVGGCVTITARMPTPPAPVTTTARADLPQIFMAPIKDARSSHKLGAIGAAGLEADAALPDYIQVQVVNGLAQQGYVVVSSTAATANMRRVAVTLQTAHVGSFDAILQPARGDVTIVIQVYSTGDTALFAQSYSGTYSETVGLHGQTGLEENVGRIAATAADQAIGKALQDSQLQTLLRGTAQITPSRK